MDLKEGEIICDKCRGTGSTKVKRKSKIPEPYYPLTMCLKCLGAGKLNWIENITGVKMRFFNFESLPKIDINTFKPFTFSITHKSK